MKKLLTILLIPVFAFVLKFPVLAAPGYSLFDNAQVVSDSFSAPNAVETVSDSSLNPAWGGVSFILPAGTKFSDLTHLSTYYKITKGDCGGGAPRFQIKLSTGQNIFVYLGPTPNFTGCTLNDWVSTGELVGSSDLRFDTSQIPGGNFYSTYSSALTLAGDSVVTKISLVTDAGWIPTGSQVVLFDNVQINGDLYTFDPPPVTVTIVKYLDGVLATPTLTDGVSFPMVSTWSATNIGAGTGTYSLSPIGFNNPNPYHATTSLMTSGASYSTNEVTGTAVLPIGASCVAGKTRLVGYTSDDSLSGAAVIIPSPVSPNFTNITTDKFVIVWNESCVAPTTKDQCKKDGWKKFNSPSFKNQGDCVSYLESSERALGNKQK